MFLREQINIAILESIFCMYTSFNHISILQVKSLSLSHSHLETKAMVLFNNVNVGQRVEVNIGWCSIKGTVQYKGSLAGKQGDWVGMNLEEKGMH